MWMRGGEACTVFVVQDGLVVGAPRVSCGIVSYP